MRTLASTTHYRGDDGRERVVTVEQLAAADGAFFLALERDGTDARPRFVACSARLEACEAVARIHVRIARRPN